jgi:hypothetical protein
MLIWVRGVMKAKSNENVKLGLLRIITNVYMKKVFSMVIVTKVLHVLVVLILMFMIVLHMAENCVNCIVTIVIGLPLLPQGHQDHLLEMPMMVGVCVQAD